MVNYPEKFAAAAVVSGMSPSPYAEWLRKDIPIWVFHGEKDKTISISESYEMVKKLKEKGRKVKFTAFKEAGHDIWGKVYDNQELYDWFISKQL